MMDLHSYEITILNCLKPGIKFSENEIVRMCGLNPDAVKRTLGWLGQKKLIIISKCLVKEKIETDELNRYRKTGFPEVRVLRKAIEKQGGADIKKLSPIEKNIGISWAKKKAWVKIEKNKIIALCRTAEKYEPSETELISRGLIEVKNIENISVLLTEKGVKTQAEIKKIKGTGPKIITKLTNEMLTHNTWKNKEFRKYNVLAESEEIYPGKRHILSRFIKKIRHIFTDMGFQEMQGPIVESSFWVFDALFQPQDHPARELADTFYVENYSKDKSNIPKKILEKVRKSHEKGWHYKWSAEVSHKNVLRCHTTSLSVKQLALLKKNNKKEGKYFAIGKVYRNETVDYKHLAEFYQVEGIIVSEKVKFKHLLGTLKEFYKKLGFEKIKFYPSYFPYTEPSVEIYVYFPSKNEWIEMGGAGIFRPEVSETLCGIYPVLAFGLSLERPLMLLNGFSDIRKPYINKIDWLRLRKTGYTCYHNLEH